MLRSAACNEATVTGFATHGADWKISSMPPDPAGYPETTKNGIFRSDSFFASSALLPSCSFMSIIATSGLWMLSHSSAESYGGFSVTA